jgi:HPt (histidine-containing phosphotransfer) domain-containing protein
VAFQGLDPAIQAVLRELQTEFLSLLPERLGELRSALTLLKTDPAARSTMKRLGHRIGGTAATVRLDEVGRVGRAIEHFVASRELWTDDDIARLAGIIALLDEWTVEALRVGGSLDAPLVDDPRFTAVNEAEAAR